MNNYTANLSVISGSKNIITLSALNFQDATTFNINFITKETSPTLNLEIDWGFGEIVTIDNRVFKLYRKDSIINEINMYSYSTIFDKVYSNLYYPSTSSLYKNLTAQFLINYADGSYNLIIQPIIIRSYDYFESVYDLKLISTNISTLTSNKKTHTFITSKDGYLVESKN